MTYHRRLSEQSRRAQPDDGLGLLGYGLAMIAVIAFVFVARWWLG